MEKFFDHVMRLILEERDRIGSFRKLAIQLGLKPVTVQKWFQDTDTGQRSPNLHDVGIIMDSIGAVLLGPNDNRDTVPTDKTRMIECDTLKKKITELEVKNIELSAQNRLLMQLLGRPLVDTDVKKTG